MNTSECPREHEVVAMVLAPWRERSEEELRNHAEACAMCREALEVATLLHQDAQSARDEVQVPAAGQVWWRAAVRARAEAVRAAERPLTWVHGVAGAIAAGMTAALLGVAWPSIERAAASLAERSWGVSPSTTDTAQLVLSTMQRSLPIVGLAAAFAILAPIAIYLAISDD